ncbi:SusC/RagA family TonB-linked outer membrane protein [Flavobacterium procerum]|uniref:SusC/RagA family TonB-linked outer membrane protein n=1 Tax=Flavobacterium procerum TaxID=1455569 RepID=A0ABV6BYG8_9FLAO
MKTFIFLFCTTVFSFSPGKIFSQKAKISIDADKTVTIDQVFDMIRKQTKYAFIYQEDLFDKLPKVTLKKGIIEADKLLAQALRNGNFQVTLSSDNTILIEEKEAEEAAANLILKGSVLDEKGMPLPGVSILLVGTNKHGVSDFDGKFSIELPAGKNVLKISYLGYKTQEISVENQTLVTIKMQPDLAKLDEIVIIGYGTTSKRTTTGSVVKIASEDIEKQPVTNVLQTLQGRTPGVFVSQSSGYAGSNVNISIRGRNSIFGDNLPLYVIDGIPYISDDIKEQVQTNFVIRGAQKRTSPLNIINPNDIESVEILKDADATAIYGSRGANGVVLITTKKGQAGKTEFTVNTASGISDVANKIRTLDTPTYLNMLRTAHTNANAVPNRRTTAMALTDFDPNAYTDWQEKLIGGAADFNDFSASLKGGNETTNFLLSAAYHKETTVLPGDFGYNKFSTNFNVNHRTLNNKLKLGATVMFASDVNKLPFFDITSYAVNTAPNRPIYNADGTYYWSAFYSSDVNPIAALDRRVEDKGNNLLTSFNVQFDIAKGFSFKTDVGYSRAQMTSEQFLPVSGINHVFYTANNNSAFLNTSRAYTLSVNNTNNFTIDPQLNYSTMLWKGNLTALVGGSWQTRKSDMPTYLNASSYSSDNLIGIIGSAGVVTSSNGSSEYKYVSLFSRVNYNVENKYILNITFRRDGSSKFGPNNRYGNFGSVGAAWVFTEENFLKDNSWLSFGKIRSSYGKIGSDDIGDYGYADTYGVSTYSVGNAAMAPARIANPNYQWEVTNKFEAALDLGFLNDRISFTAAYYRNLSSNQLTLLPLSAQAGFVNYQANLPAEVENKGLEFTLTTTNIRNKNLNWSTSFNISKNENKLLSFPGIETTSSYSQYVVGRPLNSNYLLNYTGTDASGIAQFEDVNGDGRISTGLADTKIGDRVYQGPSYPEYYGGISNSISYKGFSLDFLFQFVKQEGRSLLSSVAVQPGYPFGLANYQVDDYNDYIAQGNVLSTNFQPSFFNYVGSTATIVDASYIKLKNVSASYTIPLDESTKKVLKNVRVSLQGQNLVTFTKYRGFDPETQGLVLPPLRTVTLGTQLTF